MRAVLKGSAGISTLLVGISEPSWIKRPSPDAWSLTEIICHLRDVEQEVNLPRLKKIIQENNPFIHGVDSDRWADERDYQDPGMDNRRCQNLLQLVLKPWKSWMF